MGLAEHYDHFSQEYVVEPWPLWKQLRDEEPVARSEEHGGYYLVSRYEDAREAAADPARFTSTQSTGIPPLPIVGMIPIDLDPPAQKEYRRLLNPWFRVGVAAGYEDEIRSLAAELIDPLVGQSEFEVTAALATQLPPKTMLTFIGFPEDQWDTVITSVDEITRLRGSDPEAVMNAGMQLMGAVNGLIEARKADPGEDLVDNVIASEYREPDSENGSGEPTTRPLEDQEIIRMIAIILFGAIDTTSLAITGSLHYLATRPELQARVRDDGLSDHAVEELVRFNSPIQGLGRTVTEDTELAGCPLKKDDKVMLLWASGNRQESVFAEPDEVDLDRYPNPHLGFGHGPHKCLGRNFGKLMLKIALEEFTRRIGPFELADPDDVQYVGGETRGIKRLVLRPAG